MSHTAAYSVTFCRHFLLSLCFVLTASVFGNRELKLTPSDGAPGDYFGWSVAIDGNTAVVGACKADNGNGAESGTAYVFTFSESGWIETEFPAHAAAGENYGYSVAIDGNTLAVGAPGGNAVYVYTFNGSGWVPQQKLTAPGSLGSALAIDGDILVAGAFRDNNGQGAAYVYNRSGSTWVQSAKLTAPVPSSNNNVYFGCSVAVDSVTAADTTIVVGAYQYIYSGKVYSGAAWVWTGSGSNWTIQADLSALANAELYDGDFFGRSVAVQDDRILIGAYSDEGPNSAVGSVTFFKRTGTTWSKVGKLWASDPDTWYYGFSFSMLDNRAIVGAADARLPDGRNGAACALRWDGTAWTEETPVIANPNPAKHPSMIEMDWFGCSADLSGSSIIIGAYKNDNLGGVDSGAAYIFTTCDYVLAGDLNGDCRVDLQDLAVLSGNWLADCFTNPNDPGCIQK